MQRSTLKDKLSSPPILAFPYFSPSDGPFILDADASDLAIGAVLSQKSANGDVVIAYASRRLDKRERRYCTTRREIAKRTYRLIVPSDKISKIVREVHVELGHAGQQRTEAGVRQRLWWLKIHEDVVCNCANCKICAQTKPPTVAPRAPLQTVATVDPDHRVGVDVMGPLPTSRTGNKYILVIVDYFTKWCEAFLMPNQKAPTITSLPVNEWVALFGTLIELHSDQGAAFESHPVEDVFRMLWIHKTRTTPHHPQSNGLVERTDRTVLTIPRAVIGRYQTDYWDKIPPHCVLAYMAAVNSSTGYTPSLLTLGHELRLPIEVLTPLAPAECRGLPHYARELGERLRVIYKIAAQHQSMSQHHQKSCHDRTANGPVHRIGDHVWLFRPKPPLELRINSIARG
ncbi:uncharacterized protein DEA37_0011338 [Paragonimus westermani]|uniref:Integrase catalytic domain-containing protein n=1 Tax=Paragonimus westermani TaxID=34504 RepID=A0A5J4NPR7_9TREM|nr:uncharacterized protein DEA37_0011338 [Paragonimus westermani]